MASIEESLKAALNSLVGNQVYPMIAPQDVVSGPYITYQNIVNAPEYSLSDGITINNTRMQIDCWADDYATVKTLANSVAVAMQAAPFTNVPRSSRDAYEAPVKKYRVILDYSLWWN